jgi:pectate lyase
VSDTPRPVTRRRPLLAGLAATGLTAAVASAMVIVAFASNAFAATLFSDNFDDGNANGWSKSGGSWSVVADGTPVYRQTSTGADAKAQAGTSTWTDYATQARVKPLAFNGSGRYAAVLSRAQNMTNFYYLALTNAGTVVLGKRVGGGPTTLASASFPASVGTWYTLRLEAFGSTLRGFVNGSQLVTATDSSFSSGRVGFATYFAGASFDDLVVSTDGSPNPDPTATASPTVGPTLPPGSCNQPAAGPRGFASVNALGQAGTTGGAGGPVVEVDTAAEFTAAIARTGPLVICVRGMIQLPASPQMHNVTSDKSILGIGAASGFTGGGLNIGLPNDDSITSPPANAVHNVIIRNLVFRGATDDSVNVQMFSHHIWIDHNDLASGFDGLIDIKRGSSYVTVSWNHTHNHTKNMLLGHDDGAGAQDIGRLKVTYHHNWFDQTPQRNPRIRFGEPVHIFNNYYLHNTDVGVACQANAGCVVEGNYFENTEETVTNHYAGPTGRCVARNNVLVGESGPPDCSGSVQEPSTYYAYTVENPNTVKATVMAGSGTGKV